jgi:hypothetical protein
MNEREREGENQKRTVFGMSEINKFMLYVRVRVRETANASHNQTH